MEHAQTLKFRTRHDIRSRDGANVALAWAKAAGLHMNSARRAGKRAAQCSYPQDRVWKFAAIAG